MAETKDIAQLVAEKIEGIKSEYASLEKKVNESEQKAKDIAGLSEKLGDIQLKLSDLSEIKFGEKSVATVAAIKEMQDQVNKLEGKIADQAVSGKNRIESIETQLIKHFTGDVYKKALEMKKAGVKPDSIFELKAVTLSSLTAIGTDSIQFGLTGPLEPGVNKPNNNPTLFFDLILFF